jgi:hypothetical protein
MIRTAFPALAFAALAALATSSQAGQAVNGQVSSFKKGEAGWVGRVGPNGTGLTYIDTTMGAPRPALHTQYDDFLKNDLRFYNDKKGWTGNYAVVPSFTFGVDVNAITVQEGQGDITRDVMVYFLDFKHPPQGYDSISVGTKIGTLEMGQGWQHWSITVPDTTSLTLPDGWVGTGATDDQGNSILPPGRTFAEVMSHVDEVAIQTVPQPSKLVLDYFDVAIDNPSISAVCANQARRPFSVDKPALPAAKGSPFQPC